MTHPLRARFDVFFLSLQTIVVLFLLLHDWVDLGSLNNLAAIRSQDSRRNGMVPNTLHTLFHLVTMATLVALGLRDRL